MWKYVVPDNGQAYTVETLSQCYLNRLYIWILYEHFLGGPDLHVLKMEDFNQGI